MPATALLIGNIDIAALAAIKSLVRVFMKSPLRFEFFVVTTPRHPVKPEVLSARDVPMAQRRAILGAAERSASRQQASAGRRLEGCALNCGFRANLGRSQLWKAAGSVTPEDQKCRTLCW